ncbi:Nudix family hydrolase [Wenzhouxiangella limi]|uniref:8-oxo-dGTP diphosphatase n=1 Tax=Wenzhouxiangella limi TaxID=2707351 RepID=A0A845V953_9GAMM|nr:Nudix family hydrolase [Wenzhouxiangella limi]
MKSVAVVAAVLRDGQGRLLLAQRPAGKHLAGRWEFPGGKLEPDESPAEGLVRELAEELGIGITRSRPLLSLTHHYEDRCIRLLLREVGAWEGVPTGLEGQALAWVSLEQAGTLPMPAADRPMLKALALDPRYAISPDPAAFADTESFLSDWESRLQAGYGWVQLRANSLTASELRPLALCCGALARRYRARWMLNAEPTLAEAVGADGVHLSLERLRACRARPLPADRIVTASCQTAEDLRLAGRLGLDLVTLSPVASIGPGRSSGPQLDWSGFERLCADSPLPVLALGGVGPDDLPRARAAGGFGVAGTSRFDAS